MTIFSKAALAAGMGAMALAVSAPAQARPYYHHGGGDDAAIAVGAGLVGLVIGAAIASSDRDRYYDDGYYYDGYYGGPVGYYAGPAYYPAYPVYRGGYYYRSYPAYRGYPAYRDNYRGAPRGYRGGGQPRGDYHRDYRGGH